MADELPAWDDLRILLEVHRRGSLLAAGAHVGLSTATVARRMAALERALGRKLVHRTSQGTHVEKDGLGLVALAEELERSLAAYRRDGTGPSPYAGVVRVSVPDGFMGIAIAAVERVRREHPETFVELSSESRFVDLAAREADIGIRAGRSASAVLIERAVGTVHAGLFASAAYLKCRLPSRVLTPEVWATQDFITGDAPHGPTEWLTARGAVRFPIKVSTYDGRIEAAERGLGIVMASASVGTSHPRLARIRLDTPLPPLTFYLVMHQDLRNVARVRAVAEALGEVVAEEVAAQTKAERRFQRRQR